MMRGLINLALAMTLATLAFAPARATAAEVKAWEGTVARMTYDMEPGDLHPYFQSVDGTLIYPYTMQIGFTHDKREVEHRALFIENEYLKVTMLPDINGKLDSVLDKTTGEEVFHRNTVIKPAHISLRGAWTSGGVGWNVGPQSHTVVSYEPVNTSIQHHPDGSAALVAGGTRLDRRQHWQVRVILRPGKACLEEEITLYNPNDTAVPYYFWNNTSFPVKEGTRFIVPTSLMTDHSAIKFTPWPTHRGKDMTRVVNYTDPTSLFAWRSQFDFLGAYDSGADRGVVGYADHRVVPGKKFWTWGQADYGLQREAAIADEEIQYLEAQSGPLMTQSDYELLGPQRSLAWREWWYPVHGLGDGFEYATRDVAINAKRKSGTLALAMLATGEFPGARVIVSRDGKSLHEERIDLAPDAARTLSVQAPEGAVNVRVEAADGRVLAEYATPLAIPAQPAPKPQSDPSTATASGIYAQALELEKASNRSAARKGYAEALKKDPNHAEALKALARLELEAGLAKAARPRIERALKIDPADGQTRCLAAAIALALGEEGVALSHAEFALRRPETVSWGWDLAGRALMQKGDFKEAAEAFAEAAKADGANMRAREHEVAALLALGDKGGAKARAEAIEAAAPDNLVARLALGALKDVRPRLGNADEEAIEAATTLAEVDSFEEAERLLQAVAVRQVDANDRHPVALYWLGWLAEQQGNERAAAEWRETAARAAKPGIFAHRPETLPVLESAIARNPNDARAKLHLGNLLAGVGRVDEAMTAWQAAAQADPKLAQAWRNQAHVEYRLRKNLRVADQLYAKATEADPADQSLWRDRSAVLVEAGQAGEAMELIERMPNAEARRGDVTMALVRAAVMGDEYDRALELLGETKFTIGEFQRDTHEMFLRASLARGKAMLAKGDAEAARRDFEAALTYPPNLGIGRQGSPQEAEALYWLGKALMAQGQRDAARARWEEAVAQVDGTTAQNEHKRLSREALELTKAGGQ